MRLLISDANILIDMEAGALMETLFLLPMQFGIPDLLYYEEIEPGSPGLEDLGLQIMEVSGDFVAYGGKQHPGHHSQAAHDSWITLRLRRGMAGAGRTIHVLWRRDLVHPAHSDDRDRSYRRT